MSNKVFEPGELHEGDLILFSGKAFISRGIEMFSGSKWSHAAIYVGNGYIIEANAPGVEKSVLAPLVKQAAHICVLRIPDLTVDQMEKMKSKAYEFLNKKTKYDFLNLFTLAPYYMLRKIGIIVPDLVWTVKGTVICSELCAECALVVPFFFAKLTKLVAPQTMYANTDITRVYKD